MSEVDIPTRFARYGGDVEVLRVALAGDEVDPHRSTLPSFPAADKKADRRCTWFRTHYGNTCWELDALSPPLLRERVAAAIEHYIDWEVWLRCDAVEAAERRSLRQVLGTWHRAMSGLASI